MELCNRLNIDGQDNGHDDLNDDTTDNIHGDTPGNLHNDTPRNLHNDTPDYLHDDLHDDFKAQISAYNLPYELLLRFLRETFGENVFHVTIKGDIYYTRLPRKLTIAEKNHLRELQRRRAGKDHLRELQQSETLTLPKYSLQGQEVKQLNLRKNGTHA